MNMIETRMEQRGQGGFTLIELLVVIAILAVLAGAAIVGIGAMRDNANKTACKADLDTIATAAEAYSLEVTGGTTSVGVLESAKYLKKVDGSQFALSTDGNEWTATYTGTKYGTRSADCTT